MSRDLPVQRKLIDKLATCITMSLLVNFMYEWALVSSSIHRCAEEIRKLQSEGLRHERELKRYQQEREQNRVKYEQELERDRVRYEQELERDRVRYEHERERDRMRHKHERGIAEMRAWVDHNRTRVTFTPDGGISIEGPSQMFQGFLSQRGLPFQQQRPSSNWRQRGLPYTVEELDEESDEESDDESDDD